MRRLSEIEKEKQAVGTMVELTGVFEGIASMRIAKIKDQVQQSTQFFNDLWAIYRQIRVDKQFRFGREANPKDLVNKELYVVITSEGGFSGDIDQKLIDWMLKNYDPKKNDIVVIGHHGAIQLAQKNIDFKKYYKLPAKDQHVNTNPIVKFIQNYQNTTVYYEEYVSLSVQDVRKIELGKAVADKGDAAEKAEEIISEETYIFEPSVYAVVGHLERTILQIALSQLILNSKLAQYASRFNAMSKSHQDAEDSFNEVSIAYNRSYRADKDERLKEIINGLRKRKVA